MPKRERLLPPKPSPNKEGKRKRHISSERGRLSARGGEIAKRRLGREGRGQIGADSSPPIWSLTFTRKPPTEASSPILSLFLPPQLRPESPLFSPAHLPTWNHLATTTTTFPSTSSPLFHVELTLLAKRGLFPHADEDRSGKGGGGQRTRFPNVYCSPFFKGLFRG